MPPSDYRVLDFPGFEHEEWTGKRALNAEARALAQNKLKVISLMTGAFTSWVFRPDRTLGVDLKNNSTRQLVSYTDIKDVSLSLSCMPCLY